MQNTVIFITLGIILILTISGILFAHTMNKRIFAITKALEMQHSLIMKIQSVLKNKSATNAVAENAEMIYQD